jgi:hypothetical protein
MKNTRKQCCVQMFEFIVMMYKSCIFTRSLLQLELWACTEASVHTLMVGGTPALSI